jgi:hypothetical protein
MSANVHDRIKIYCLVDKMRRKHRELNFPEPEGDYPEAVMIKEQSNGSNF